jgi:hypothetical protein
MISDNTRIIQVNLNRSQAATENTLQLAIELKVDIIVIQEPFITRGNDGNIDLITARSIAHPSFTQILPKYSGFRPRTLVYISKAYNPSISVSTLSPIDSDFLIVDITQNNQKIRLYNIYNQNRQNNKTTHNYPLQHTHLFWILRFFRNSTRIRPEKPYSFRL